MGDFMFTDDMANANALNTTVWAGISMVPCLFILIVSAVIYSYPDARHTLDRLSFRLMLITMVSEIAFNICYILLDPGLPIETTPTAASCSVLVYFQVALLALTNYLCTCIAINLALCVTFQIDTRNKRCEFWYLVVSFGMAFGITIIPAALGHFGDDPVFESCYFTSSDPIVRLVHFGVDLYLWQGLATLIAIAAVGTVIYTLVKQGRETTRALVAGHDANRDIEQASHQMGDTQLNFLQNKLMGITIRISLYPIALILVNVILTVGDMYLSAYGDPTNVAEYGLYVVYNFLYGARSLPFAALGIFADPSLIRGLRCVWGTWKEKKELRDSQGSDSPLMLDELAPGCKEDDEMDLFSALAGSQTTTMQTAPLAVTYLRGPSAPPTPKVEDINFEDLVIPELETVPESPPLERRDEVEPQVVITPVTPVVPAAAVEAAELSKEESKKEEAGFVRGRGAERRPPMARSASGNLLTAAARRLRGEESRARAASATGRQTEALRRKQSRRRSSGGSHNSRLSPEEEELLKVLDDTVKML